jgi:hypothetical protein
VIFKGLWVAVNENKEDRLLEKYLCENRKCIKNFRPDKEHGSNILSKPYRNQIVMAKVVFNNQATVSLSGHVTGPNFKICRSNFPHAMIEGTNTQHSLDISGFRDLGKENVWALLFSRKHC